MKISLLSRVIASLAGFAVTQVWAEPASFLVDRAEGMVWIQGEDGFARLSAGLLLSPNQQILVKPNSALLLTGIETGCFVHVTAPGLYTISEDMACNAGQLTVLKAGYTISPANGTYETLPPGFNTPPLVGGAFFAAALGAAAWQQFRDEAISTH